jgi:hypothetical protein
MVIREAAVMAIPGSMSVHTIAVVPLSMRSVSVSARGKVEGHT